MTDRIINQLIIAYFIVLALYIAYHLIIRWLLKRRKEFYYEIPIGNRTYFIVMEKDGEKGMVLRTGYYYIK